MMLAKNLFYCLTLVLLFSCIKKKSGPPEDTETANPDKRLRVMGHYQGVFMGSVKQGTSEISYALHGGVLVDTHADRNSLTVDNVPDPQVLFNEADNTFGNSTCTGKFINDSIYLKSYSTAASSSFTTFAGRKSN